MEGILFALYWIVLIALDLFILWKLGTLLYPTKEEFFESLKYVFTPDIVSLFRGEYMRDRMAEFKIGLIPLVGMILIFIEIAIAGSLFGI